MSQNCTWFPDGLKGWSGGLPAVLGLGHWQNQTSSWYSQHWPATATCLLFTVKTRLLGGIPHTDLQQPPAATGEHTVGYSGTSIPCNVFRFSSQPWETIYAPNQTVKKGDEWRNEVAAFFAQDELYLTTAWMLPWSHLLHAFCVRSFAFAQHAQDWKQDEGLSVKKTRIRIGNKGEKKRMHNSQRMQMADWCLTILMSSGLFPCPIGLLLLDQIQYLNCWQTANIKSL